MEGKHFPNNELEALALIYVEKAVANDSTPEQLLDMYHAALKRLEEKSAELKRENGNRHQSMAF